jgi:hypothetical protein
MMGFGVLGNHVNTGQETYNSSSTILQAEPKALILCKCITN